jgi:hypothetical protein
MQPSQQRPLTSLLVLLMLRSVLPNHLAQTLALLTLSQTQPRLRLMQLGISGTFSRQ